MHALPYWEHLALLSWTCIQDEFLWFHVLCELFFTCALGAEGAVCDEVGIAACVFSCHTFEVNLPVRAACILSYCKSLQSLVLPHRTLKYYPESCMIVKGDT